MSGRLIAIGDIHGCATEFDALLEKLRPGPEDRIILLGDLVNRGPDSARVIDIAMEIHAVSVLGNHERRLLRHRRSGDDSLLKEADRLTIPTLRPRHWEYIEAMPLTHHCPEAGIVFVHAGFLPGMPWNSQPSEVVTRIQVVDAEGMPRMRADSPESPHWTELWHGPPFVVYGHTPRRTVQLTEWTAGIDTACVLGGFLTACILPEGGIVQVKALRPYYP